MLPESIQINPTLQTVMLVVALIFYLAQCLFGYRLFKFSCAVVGFFIGLLLGMVIASNVFKLEGPWPLIIGIIAGILLALIAFKLFLVGLFALVFLLAFSLAIKIPFPQTDVWNVVALIIAVAIAVLVAILAVKFSSVVIIVVTSVAGSLNAVSVFNQLTNYLTSTVFYLLVFAILAAIGLILQFMMNRK